MSWFTREALMGWTDRSKTFEWTQGLASDSAAISALIDADWYVVFQSGRYRACREVSTLDAATRSEVGRG